MIPEESKEERSSFDIRPGQVVPLNDDSAVNKTNFDSTVFPVTVEETDHLVGSNS